MFPNSSRCIVPEMQLHVKCRDFNICLAFSLSGECGSLYGEGVWE